MDIERLEKIRRMTAADVLTSVPGGQGYEDRLLRAIEVAMNLEWWWGYHSRAAILPSQRYPLSEKDILTPKQEP